MDTNTAFVSDPLSGNKRYMRSGAGFRGNAVSYLPFAQQGSYTYAPYRYESPAVEEVPPMAIPDGDDKNTSQYGPYGTTDRQQRNVAGSFGYQQQDPNVMISMLNALNPTPFKMEDPKYGLPGTYGPDGNIFATNERSYDPITGAPKGFKDLGTVYDTFLNPETNNWSKMNKVQRYNKDTEEFEQLPFLDRLLGSPEASVYTEIGGVPRLERMEGINPATENYGLRNTYAALYNNTYGYGTPGAARPDQRTQDIGRMFGTHMDGSGNLVETSPRLTYDHLGINKNSIGGLTDKPTGVLGYTPGDAFIDPNNDRPYIIAKDGSVVGSDGTKFSWTNPVTQEKTNLFNRVDPDDPSKGVTSKGSNINLAHATHSIMPSTDYFQDFQVTPEGVKTQDGFTVDYDPGFTVDSKGNVVMGGQTNPYDPGSVIGTDNPYGNDYVPREVATGDEYVDNWSSPPTESPSSSSTDSWSNHWDDTGQDHTPSTSTSASVNDDPAADESTSSSSSDHAAVHGGDWGDWGTMHSKGGRIPSIQAGGK